MSLHPPVSTFELRSVTFPKEGEPRALIHAVCAFSLREKAVFTERGEGGRMKG